MRYFGIWKELPWLEGLLIKHVSSPQSGCRSSWSMPDMLPLQPGQQ